MINPNAVKKILVVVSADRKWGEYRGVEIPIWDRPGQPTKQPGRRQMYLRYSIFNDCYYLKSV